MQITIIKYIFSLSRREKPNPPCGPIIVYMVVFLAVGAFHIFLDPFDLGKSAALHAQDVVMLGYLGPTYGRWKRYTDQVTVVLLRDSSLNKLQLSTDMVDTAVPRPGDEDADDDNCVPNPDQILTWGWPLSMSAHATILQAIQGHNPKAIFVDILFLDQRPNDGVEAMNCFLARSTLAVEQGRAKRSNTTATEIFFASPGSVAMRPDLFKADCDEKPREVCGGEKDRLERFQEENILPSPKKPEEGALRSYPASVKLLDSKANEPERAESTAAFTLLKRVNIPSPWRPDGGPLIGNPTFDLEMIWGTEPNYINARWMPCQNFDYSIWRWFWNMLTQPTEAFTQTCPYIATVPVESLLSSEPDWDVRALLANRIVFYGVELHGSSDIVYPPVHKHLPGVYMHAMAMDNLLTLGPDYLRRLGPSEGRMASFGALILLAGIYCIFARRSQYLEALVRDGGTWITVWAQGPNLILYSISSWGILVIYGYLMFLLFQAAPFDWLSALALWAGLSVSWFFQLFARHART